MKIKASELSGPALDWLVSQNENIPVYININKTLERMDTMRYELFNPISNWAQGGPIIENNPDCAPTFYYGCGENNPNKWQAGSGLFWSRGKTPLEAAMRAYVLKTLCDEEWEIDIPDVFL